MQFFLLALATVAAFQQRPSFLRSHCQFSPSPIQAPEPLIEWDDGEVSWFGLNETVVLFTPFNKSNADAGGVYE